MNQIPDMHLTPLHLEIIIWYNSRADDMENLNAPAQSQYIRQLIEDGIIVLEDRENICRTYKLTDKGVAFLDALLSVPYPIQKWEVQWPKS